MLEVVRKMRSILEKRKCHIIKSLIVSSNCCAGHVKLGNDGCVEEINLMADENTRMQVVVSMYVWIAPR